MAEFSYTLDQPPGAALGLVVLQSDERLELDCRRLIPDAARLYVSRVPSGLEVTRETLSAMEAELTAAAALFPRPVSFDAVGYGCTSGTAVIGADHVAAMIRKGTETRAVTEPVSALIAACRALGLSRIALLSPYVAEVSGQLRTVLSENGIATPVLGSFNEASEARVARIAPASVVEAGTALGAAAEVEALFLSCTNLNTLDAIPAIEARIGKPVLSSNLVLAWHLCALAGIKGEFGPLSAAAP